MTAEEKRSIWTFLKTAQGFCQGYRPKDFDGSDISFQDDMEKEVKIQQPSPLPTETNSVSATSANAPEKNAALQMKTPEEKENPSPSASSGPMTITKLNEKIGRCVNCVLSQTKKIAVPGNGTENPHVVVVGEFPSEKDEATSTVFSDQTGELLDKMLAAISLSRDTNCFITTLVKCRPPMMRSPMKDEILACQGYLNAQVHILKPKMVLFLGRQALDFASEGKLNLQTDHGRIFDWQGIPSMAIQSPQTLLAHPELKGQAWNDLKAFRIQLTVADPEYDLPFLRSKE